MTDQKGEVIVIILAALGVVLFTTLAIIAGAQIYFSNSHYSSEAEQATALAEAGIDKAITSLNKTGGSYLGENETSLGVGSYSVTITSKDAATKVVEATGYIPSKDKSRVKRAIKVSISRGVGVAFNYGIQVGEGGMELGNSNIVKGSVYSNGSISAGNSNQIQGDVYVAGGPQPTSDQQTDCLMDSSNCQDYKFGKTEGSEDRADVAQSFKPASSGSLNKVSFKIKKFGSPPDATVRILQDNDGKPDKNAVLTIGTLYSNLVTDEYGWIDVTFATLPALTADTTYWLMVSSTLDSSKYWIWQNDSAQSYTRGQPKWSSKWNHGSPTWTVILGDLSFKTYMGGAPTSIRASGGNNMVVSGEAHANTLENLTIGKDAYFQTLISSTVGGVSHPNSADPPPKVFPISDANVTDWKRQAGNCDSALNNCQNVQNGDITNCVNILESKKYAGNINFNSGCNITIKTPVWISGDLTLNSNNTITLDSSYGQTSGAIIVDGKVILNSNNHLNGTGLGSSLLMVLTTFDTVLNNDEEAVAVNSNGNTGVYYASKGSVNPGTGNTFKELTAWKIKLINSSIIDYETGLSSTLFTSGPSGTYSLIKGTYQIK